ncbi:MAG: polysaccharide pyruvyl transferase family protein [bacterium]|nr:polysaccharide pyruvyl transferase family protein [bacterium]
MQLVLVGNYGVENLGDEALKEYFLNRFTDIDWKVLSANPSEGEYPRLPTGLRSFLTTNWLKTLSVIRRSDGVVFGGGSLFTDVESVFACFLWGCHAFAAMLFRKKIYLAFQGIGPFQTAIGERLSRCVFAHSSVIIVRDASSLERTKSWRKNTKVVQSFDPIYAAINSQNTTVRTQNVLIVIPRKNSGEMFSKRVQNVVKNSKFESAIIVSMEPLNRQEQLTCSHLQASLELSSVIVAVHSIDELSQTLSLGSQIISHRYHGALTALALGKPLEIVSQVEGDKLSSLRAVDQSQIPTLISDGENALCDAF